MTDGEQKELIALITLLRGQGVTKYRHEGTEIELAPMPSDKPVADLGELDANCNCGHASTEHQNGLCLIGCPVEQCAPEAT